MPIQGQVGFVVDKVALGRVLSEYFGFPLALLIPSTVPRPLTILPSTDSTQADYSLPSGKKVKLSL
jgi:hypothetical protein